MSVTLIDDKYHIEYRAGTTQELILDLTYYPDETSTEGTPMDLSSAKFKFVAFDEESGKTKFEIPMDTLDNTVSCLIDHRRKLICSFSVVLTQGRSVTDFLTGILRVY